MMDIHLTSDDIGRVTVVSTYGQLSEVFFSLALLCKRRSSFLYGAWARELSPEVRQACRALSGLVSCPPPLDLVTLTPPSTTLDAGIEALLEAPAIVIRTEIDSNWSNLTSPPPRWLGDLPTQLSVRHELGRTLTGFYDAALAGHWPRVRAHLDAQAVAYARTLAKGGLQAFLQSLHPELRWSPPILTVHRPGPYGHLWARGRGLVIVPIVFAQHVTVFHSLAHPDEPIVIAVPALRSIAAAHAIWGVGSLPTPRALSALIGDTRAAALDVISESCTTTELARRLGISPATASHHATVLRSAGLVMTQRLGSAVLHTVTPLGAELLNGRPGDQRRWEPA